MEHIFITLYLLTGFILGIVKIIKTIKKERVADYRFVNPKLAMIYVYFCFLICSIVAWPVTQTLFYLQGKLEKDDY